MARFSGIRAGVTFRSVTLLAVALAFTAGYRLAVYFQVKTKVSNTAGVPPTDFAIPLPEGSTRITITDPQLDNPDLAAFVVQREGNSFKGIPDRQITLAPRSHLSLNDVSFFRHELSGIILASDSSWQRANRIRNWLSTSRYKVALPGLGTRVPREAYVEMRQGKPVLCGNLAVTLRKSTLPSAKAPAWSRAVSASA